MLHCDITRKCECTACIARPAQQYCTLTNSRETIVENCRDTKLTLITALPIAVPPPSKRNNASTYWRLYKMSRVAGNTVWSIWHVSSRSGEKACGELLYTAYSDHFWASIKICLGNWILTNVLCVYSYDGLEIAAYSTAGVQQNE